MIFLGCAQLTEPLKVVWGSSTRALEEARSQAVKKTFLCQFDECFDSVIKIVKGFKPETQEGSTPLILGKADTEEEENKEAKSVGLDLFIKDRKKRLIVVMGIPGSVNTTEVGIFLTPVDKKVVLEVSSLSQHAKSTVANIIFGELSKEYQAVE